MMDMNDRATAMRTLQDEFDGRRDTASTRWGTIAALYSLNATLCYVGAAIVEAIGKSGDEVAKAIDRNSPGAL